MHSVVEEAATPELGGRTLRPLAKRRVCVCFGENIVAEKTWPSPVAAARYEDGMRRRFAALRVTNDPAEDVAVLR